MENTNINLENYLCFKRTYSDMYMSIHYETNGNITPNIEYSNDEGISWQPWIKPKYDTYYYIPISSDDVQVYVRGVNTSRISDSENYFHLENVSISGNLMSLVDGCGLTKDIPADYMFSNLFYGGPDSVIIRSLLFPATKLTNGCYYKMFSNNVRCLEKLVLPATTLADSCYESMFSEVDFVTAGEIPSPELPSTTLANRCYAYMFSDASINNAPELPATILADSCYEGMFSNCGLDNAPELPATTLADSCYKGMFSGASINNAPAELPATILAESCYESMFSYCSSLTTTPKLPATTLSNYCYYNMFHGCSSLTTAPELPATVLANSCYESMFSYCSSLIHAPELPAKNLTFYCYNNMFNGCSKINKITCLAENIFVEGCREGWVSGVDLSNGTFIKAKGVSWPIHHVNGIPKKWNIEEIEIDTPSIPPSSSTGNKFNGFHMVKQTTYNKLLKDGLIDKALYFVRDFDNENNPNKTSIYFGERLYASNYGIDGDDS